MKTADPDLIALLEAARDTGGPIAQCELYEITLQSGPTLYLTTADMPVFWQGNTYLTNPPIDVEQTRSTGHWKTGLDVDQWNLVIAPRAVEPATGQAFPDMIGGTPWISAARAGLLDQAQVVIHRGYFSTPAAFRNPLFLHEVLEKLFVGTVADIGGDSTTIEITINSPLELLTTQMPRNLFSSSCRHRLYDSGCTLNAASFHLNGTVDIAYPNNPNQFHSALDDAAGSGTYIRGYVVWTSGANAGTQQSVRNWFGGNFTLIVPPVNPIQVGDAFQALPGCDKSMANCNAFQNIANFGGFPFIPAPEVAV